MAAVPVPVFEPLFHAWERRLAAVSTTHRTVRPFDWGLDWLPANGVHREVSHESRLDAYVKAILADSDRYLTPDPTTDYELTPAQGDDPAWLRFPTSRPTPHPENNVVHARYFPGVPGRSQRRRAVVVMPQWNSDLGGHVGLSKLLARFGISALRLSLPYHDRRMPPELRRADYIVSSNVARTLEVCRQAVHDARRAIWWLEQQGYERIGMLGTSLGSCLAMLTTAHEPLESSAGAQSRVSVLRRRRVARSLDRARAGGTRGRHRPRAVAPAVDANQPVSVPRADHGSPHAARLRAVRPDVSGRYVQGDHRRVPTAADSASSARPAVRSLHDGRQRRSSTWTATSSRGFCSRISDREGRRRHTVSKGRTAVKEFDLFDSTLRPFVTLRPLDLRDQRYFRSPESAP